MALYLLSGALKSASFLLALTTSFLLMCCIRIKGNKLPASFVFGDSLVDSGNNNYLVSLSKANCDPNGIDFGGPTGRYTNGRTIADIIGQQIGLDFLPPYMAPTTTGSVILKGVNYGSGGGGILNQTGQVYDQLGRPNRQLCQYKARHNPKYWRVGGSPTFLEVPTRQLFSKSLFSVTIGSNDFINNYLLPVVSTAEQKLVPPEQFVSSMIAKLRPQLTRLHGLGARKILVVNVGPIGCIPFQRDINPNAGDNCASFPNELAQSYNSKLKTLVDELRTTIPGSNFVYANVNRIVNDILQNYASYGFQNPNSACCSLGGQHGGLSPCVPSSKVCSDRSKYVFWDAAHPSDATNAIIAKRLLDGDSNDISPYNVRHLVSMD